MKTCPICRGGGHVRLPVYRDVSAFVSKDILMGATSVEEAYRTYPCPECRGQQAAEERVHVIYAEEVIRNGSMYTDDIRNHVAHGLAHASARKMLADGLIEIREEKRGDDLVFLSRIGVVSPRMVATIERRAFDAMTKFLGSVRQKAAEAIAVWGSAYTGNEGMISKGQAMDFVDEAFNRHIIEVQLSLEDAP
jgi:hypothetical protein